MTPSADLFAVAGVGLVLGLRHAFEPDHLAAVSTLATRQGKVLPAAGLGVAWGLGHTAAVGVVVLVVIGLGIRLPEKLWPMAELGVGVLLVALGASVLARHIRGRWHIHQHVHGGAPHFHLHSHAVDPGHAHQHADLRRALGFGVLHGLAGSAAVIVLLVAAAPSAGLRTAYFVAFGLGTVVGMLVVSLTLGMVVRAATGRGERWARAIHLGSAAASIAVGIALAGAVLAG
jgi:sulfite exporter TauE/SafE